MTITRLLSKSELVSDIGVLVYRLFVAAIRLSRNSIYALKIILVDATVALNRLPFGNWISVVYFIVACASLKNIIEGGELARLANRGIHIYFVERQNSTVLLDKFKLYLIRSLQSRIYAASMWIWGHSGAKVKREVSKFAKEVIMDNADEIEKRAIEFAKGAAITAIISTATQNVIGPAIHTVSSQLNHVIETNEIKNDELIAKINSISLQLEYLKTNNPDQFHAILNYIYSTIPLSAIDVLFQPLMQNNRNRIEFM